MNRIDDHSSGGGRGGGVPPVPRHSSVGEAAFVMAMNEIVVLEVGIGT
jgi:hypothetical protein